jgi:hydantoinase/carbamoylase family amidase
MRKLPEEPYERPPARSDGRRLLDDLDALAHIGRSSEGGADRVAWSEADEQGKRWLEQRLTAAGLTVRRDAAANVWGTWQTGAAPALVLGSHIDSVPNGGHYDGALGVLAGLEAVRSLRATAPAAPHPVEVVAFSDEEGSRFGSGFFGSLALTGQLDPAAFAALKDAGGTPATEILQARGVSPAAANAASEHLAQIGAYLELHIEQGPELEATGIPIGIVTAIKGAYRGILRLRGEANHAGTTSMQRRHDAGIGAARAIGALREAVIHVSSDAVGTVGRTEFQPGGLNVIPGGATVWFEVRDEDTAVVERVVADFADRVRAIATEEGLDGAIEHVSTVESVRLAPAIVEATREVCESLGIPYKLMPSGAGHDAMIVARHLPAGMIFVPCRGGKSHSPVEHVDDEHIILGAHVLAKVSRRLLDRGLETLFRE